MIRSSFSLEGEDLLAESILRLSRNGRYFDIGCSSPTEISNTYLFYKKGWRGVAVDGRHELKSAWEAERPEDIFLPLVLDEMDGETTFWTFPDPTMNTCDELTASRYAQRFATGEYRVEKRSTRSAKSLWIEVYGNDATPPEFVSLDVEGHELPILKGLVSLTWRPALLLVETKLFTFDDPCSHPLVSHLCAELGYKLIAKTPLDAFFIDPQNPVFEWLPSQMR